LETAIIQAEADANAERARQAAANAPSIVTAQTVNNSKTEVVSPGMSSMNPDIRAAQMAGGAAGMRGFAME
jgi:UDP-N-acetylmuramoylalanine-D-glutamate ligase